MKAAWVPAGVKHATEPVAELSQPKSALGDTVKSLFLTVTCATHIRHR